MRKQSLRHIFYEGVLFEGIISGVISGRLGRVKWEKEIAKITMHYRTGHSNGLLRLGPAVTPRGHVECI